MIEGCFPGMAHLIELTDNQSKFHLKDGRHHTIVTATIQYILKFYCEINWSTILSHSLANSIRTRQIVNDTSIYTVTHQFKGFLDRNMMGSVIAMGTLNYRCLISLVVIPSLLLLPHFFL